MIKKLLLIIISIWLVISVGRLIVNIFQIYSQDSINLFKSDDIKRRESYGSVYDAILKLKEITHKDHKIGIITNDGKNFYLARYYLYPTKVYWIDNEVSIQNVNHDFYLFINYDKRYEKLINNREIIKVGDALIVKNI